MILSKAQHRQLVVLICEAFSPLADAQHFDAPQNLTRLPFLFTFCIFFRMQNDQSTSCSPADRARQAAAGSSVA
jgi:hypothetical protein